MAAGLECRPEGVASEASADGGREDGSLIVAEWLHVVVAGQVVEEGEARGLRGREVCAAAVVEGAEVRERWTGMGIDAVVAGPGGGGPRVR
jgi:hypothetical protein